MVWMHSSSHALRSASLHVLCVAGIASRAHAYRGGFDASIGSNRHTAWRSKNSTSCTPSFVKGRHCLFHRTSVLPWTAGVLFAFRRKLSFPQRCPHGKRKLLSCRTCTRWCKDIAIHDCAEALDWPVPFAWPDPQGRMLVRDDDGQPILL